ncbi:hypothetical protein ACJX0J_029165, partial [Zea mays]
LETSLGFILVICLNLVKLVTLGDIVLLVRLYYLVILVGYILFVFENMEYESLDAGATLYKLSCILGHIPIALFGSIDHEHKLAFH